MDDYVSWAAVAVGSKLWLHTGLSFQDQFEVPVLWPHTLHFQTMTISD
jgi:hypothetical protein